MRFLFTIGRMTVFHISLFEIMELDTPEPDVIVVHHHNDEEDEEEGPGDLFGGKGN